MYGFRYSQPVHLKPVYFVWSIIQSRKEATMKFTDGYWQIRAGMTPHYAAQAYEVEIEIIKGSMMIKAGHETNRLTIQLR